MSFISDITILFQQNKTHKEIANILNCSISSITSYKKKLGFTTDYNSRIENKYEWDKIQKYLELNGVTKTRNNFKISHGTWAKAAKRNLISYKHCGKYYRDIVDRLNDGQPISQIVEEVGCAKATVSYYRKNLGFIKPKSKLIDQTKIECKYNWVEISAFLANSTRQLTMIEFGITNSAWAKARKKGLVPKLTSLKSDEEVYSVNSQYKKNFRLFKRLIKERGETCEECGIGGEWNGKPIRLQVDHMNGTRNDNRMENLRLLCPNCHSQTMTYAGKNVKNPHRISKRWRCD